MQCIPHRPSQVESPISAVPLSCGFPCGGRLVSVETPAGPQLGRFTRSVPLADRERCERSLRKLTGGQEEQEGELGLVSVVTLRCCHSCLPVSKPRLRLAKPHDPDLSNAVIDWPWKRTTHGPHGYGCKVRQILLNLTVMPTFAMGCLSMSTRGAYGPKISLPISVAVMPKRHMSSASGPSRAEWPLNFQIEPETSSNSN